MELPLPTLGENNCYPCQPNGRIAHPCQNVYALRTARLVFDPVNDDNEAGMSGELTRRCAMAVASKQHEEDYPIHRYTHTHLFAASAIVHLVLPGIYPRKCV
eukprot:1752568-Amphidinium_carterae.1